MKFYMIVFGNRPREHILLLLSPFQSVIFLHVSMDSDALYGLAGLCDPAGFVFISAEIDMNSFQLLFLVIFATLKQLK